MKIEEIKNLLIGLGAFLTGIASLITAIKPKKEQPKQRSRARKHR